MTIDSSELWHVDASELDNFEQRYRARFINSLSGFKSANLIGTVSESGVRNLAIVNSVFHIGANPPLMGMITRPNTARRDTVENLQATGYYTINHVHRGIFHQAHQTSARYDAHIDEFEAVGLTPVNSASFAAPYVAEAVIRIGLKVEEVKHLDINSTDLVIGRITELSLPRELVGDDGFIDIEGAGSLAISSLDAYHQTERLDRLSYAKPDKPVKSIL